jgi:hypothetical protein
MGTHASAATNTWKDNYLRNCLDNTSGIVDPLTNILANMRNSILRQDVLSAVREELHERVDCDSTVQIRRETREDPRAKTLHRE